MFCAHQNESLVSLSLDKLGFSRIIGIAGRNEIVGSIGRCIDSLLVRKTLRKCLILGSLELGEKLANSTYTGSLGMIQSRRADLLLRAETDYLHEDWLAKSVPVQMEKVLFGHSIRDQKAFTFFNLLDSFKFGIGLAAAYLLSFFGILVTAFLINELACRVRSGERRTIQLSKRLSSAVSSFSARRLSSIGVFVLFVHLFFWLTQLFLTNNIQTNQVVVDTSQLIKDERDIFSTRRVACILQNEQLHNMIVSSPTKNILSWVFYEKTKLRDEMTAEREILQGDRCLLSKNHRMYQLLTNDFFFVGEHQAGNLAFAASFLLADLLGKHWISERSLFEYKLVLYHNPEKPGIGKMILAHTEGGLFARGYDCTDQVAKESVRSSNLTLFESLDQYVEANSGFSDLVLDNFRHIFLHHFRACSLAAVLFCVHHLAKFTKKRLRVVRFLMEDYLARCASGLRK